MDIDFDKVEYNEDGTVRAIDGRPVEEIMDGIQHQADVDLWGPILYDEPESEWDKFKDAPWFESRAQRNIFFGVIGALLVVAGYFIFA